METETSNHLVEALYQLNKAYLAEPIGSSDLKEDIFFLRDKVGNLLMAHNRSRFQEIES